MVEGLSWLKCCRCIFCLTRALAYTWNGTPHTTLSLFSPDFPDFPQSAHAWELWNWIFNKRDKNDCWVLVALSTIIFALLDKTRCSERKLVHDYAIIWRTIPASQMQSAKLWLYRQTYLWLSSALSCSPTNGSFNGILLNMKNYWHLRTDTSTNVNESK